jgi:hypothetical protein
MLENFMTPFAKEKINNLRHCGHLLWEYCFFVQQQLRNPLNYISSALIGLLVMWILDSFSIFALLVAFLVQTAVQAVLRFKNRDMETLLLLPGQREDPAFVMGLDGSIVLATGNTERLFKKNAIKNIIDLIEAEGLDGLISKLDHRCPDPETRSIELYSKRLQNWYEIKFKPIISHCGRLPDKLLVWFSEKTSQKEAELRQRDLLHYTDSLISNIKALAKQMSTYDHLAAFILTNYQGVLIARIDPDGNLNGYVFKHSGELLRSDGHPPGDLSSRLGIDAPD